jgi:hypothetical protein
MKITFLTTKGASAKRDLALPLALASAVGEGASR